MTRICPDCNGRQRIGRKPCPTCNPSGAVGDIAVSVGRRLRNAVTGRTASTDGQTTTHRPHRLAPETTTRAAAPRTPAAKKKAAAARRRTPAATPAAVQMPKCESCGTRGVLKVTSKGAVCKDGCA